MGEGAMPTMNLTVRDGAHQTHGDRMRNKRPEEAVEEIRCLLTALNFENVLVVVEGMRDTRVLRAFGYKGRIFELSGSGGGYSKLAEVAKSFSRVVVLIDTDRKGEALEEGMKRRLEYAGLNLDFEFRKRLKKAAAGFTHLEELSRYLPYLTGNI